MVRVYTIYYLLTICYLLTIYYLLTSSLGRHLSLQLCVQVFIVMWMVTVTWWVFRHRIGPATLTRVLGEDIMVNFRMALGDTDAIHDVSRKVHLLVK